MHVQQEMARLDGAGGDRAADRGDDVLVAFEAVAQTVVLVGCHGATGWVVVGEGGAVAGGEEAEDYWVVGFLPCFPEIGRWLVVRESLRGWVG